MLADKAQRALTSLRELPMDLVFGLLFVAGVYASAVVAQSLSDMSPWEEGSPLDIFSGTSLWAGSMLCFAMAFRRRSVFGFRELFWLGACAGIAFLGIDEAFAIHERTIELVGDDDYPKYLLWVAVPVGVLFVYKLEGLARVSKVAFGFGFLIHTIYIIEEAGDGDIFRLPLEGDTLRSIEDYLDLAFVLAYLFALMMVYTRSSPLRDASSDRAAVSLHP